MTDENEQDDDSGLVVMSAIVTFESRERWGATILMATPLVLVGVGCWTVGDRHFVAVLSGALLVAVGVVLGLVAWPGRERVVVDARGFSKRIGGGTRRSVPIERRLTRLRLVVVEDHELDPSFVAYRLEGLDADGSSFPLLTHPNPEACINAASRIARTLGVPVDNTLETLGTFALSGSGSADNVRLQECLAALLQTRRPVSLWVGSIAALFVLVVGVGIVRAQVQRGGSISGGSALLLVLLLAIALSVLQCGLRMRLRLEPGTSISVDGKFRLISSSLWGRHVVADSAGAIAPHGLVASGHDLASFWLLVGRDPVKGIRLPLPLDRSARSGRS